ncbi:DUF3775 domain-containing protein [Rhizobium calliandrae]|uniref:DUF3775 domain-containing protein n=1 Tax=Rhizobium calliandrae TaxID=1312182 RepID=UPI003D80A6AC
MLLHPQGQGVRCKGRCDRTQDQILLSIIEVLEDHSDDPVEAEPESATWALNEDKQIDLVALAWLGRGDGGMASGMASAPRQLTSTTIERLPISSARRSCLAISKMR